MKATDDLKNIFNGKRILSTVQEFFYCFVKVTTSVFKNSLRDCYLYSFLLTMITILFFCFCVKARVVISPSPQSECLAIAGFPLLCLDMAYQLSLALY